MTDIAPWFWFAVLLGMVHGASSVRMAVVIAGVWLATTGLYVLIAAWCGY